MMLSVLIHLSDTFFGETLCTTVNLLSKIRRNRKRKIDYRKIETCEKNGIWDTKL